MGGCDTLKRIDFLILGIITLLFTILVFYRIGNTEAPESFYTATRENCDIVLDLGENTPVSHIYIYLGHLNTRSFTVSAFNVDNTMWDLLSGSETAESVFDWNRIDVNYTLHYLGLVALDDESVLGEMIIVADDGSVILPVNASEYPELFDEQDTFSLPQTYMTGTMFDEVYHGRTAYEFIHGLTTYETTHPPLGKTLISLGIRLFGMTPFGWRFIPALFGILMIPLIYLFGKALFNNTLAAASVTVLLAADCMHFTLSRIATIDIIAAFFILLMYYLMLLYFLTDLKKLPGNPYLPLGLSGIAMGLAVATKWTGIYAGIGLGLLFFWYLITHFPKKENKVFRLLGFCLLFFALIPAGIYLLSYLPFVDGTGRSNLFLVVLENTKYILSYHSDLVAEHYYASPFYQWPYIHMPLLYATDMTSSTMVSSVSCMGNPAIWWFGIPCILYSMYRWLMKDDKTAGFLVIAYLVQYIPWFFVGRITFIYHYFPSSLFMILLIGYTLNRFAKLKPWCVKAVYGYLLVVVVVFGVFFPVISGIPADWDYENSLRLLKDWILVL